MKLALGFKGERFIYLPLSILENMDNNPLTGDLYVYSLGYFSRAAHHYIDRPKGCDQHLLIYCKAGRGTIRIGNRTHTLSPDRFIILPPGVAHRYAADENDPWSIYWLHFRGDKAARIAEGFDVPHTAGLRTAKRLDLFEEMYAVLKKGFTPANIDYANLCLGHFLGSLVYAEQPGGTGGKSEYEGCIINRSIYYMQECIDKNPPLEEIASFINYSPSYFFRKFKKETGVAPMTYFTRMKIDKARNLLTETDLRINQIATLLGYADPLYFSRVFTKTAGVSPNSYRMAHSRNKAEENAGG